MVEKVETHKLTPEQAEQEINRLIKTWTKTGELYAFGPKQIAVLREDIANNLQKGLGTIQEGQKVTERGPSILGKVGDREVTVCKGEEGEITVELPPRYGGRFRSYSSVTGVAKLGPEYGWLPPLQSEKKGGFLEKFFPQLFSERR